MGLIKRPLTNHRHKHSSLYLEACHRIAEGHKTGIKSCGDLGQFVPLDLALMCLCGLLFTSVLCTVYRSF
jgi:hypothetical protein